MLPRAARLTAALRDRRKIVAITGAAAALAGTGAGTAAALTSTTTATAAADRGAVTRPAVPGTTSHTTTASRPATTPAKNQGPVRPATTVAKHVTKPAAKPAKPARAARPARPSRPFLMFDSTTPQAIPAHHQIATYANGGYAVPASQVTGRNVMWIDTNGSDTHAAALDVEPGDATPAIAANWAQAKVTAQPGAIAHIYTMLSEWPAVKADVAALPHHVQSHVRYWIADPTGHPHLVPGSQATQWYWGHSYDISTVKPSFQ